MIVFTNGCFDIIHRGHVELLRFAKQQGTHLIVGLNSDRSVRRLKGPTRPIIHESDRKAVLMAIRWVDEVMIFDEDTPYELIKKTKPDIIVKGGDYQADSVVGNDLAKVVIYPYLRGHSTTEIINYAKSTEGLGQ